MLEYIPEPWNQWNEVGNLQTGRRSHSAISFGPSDLQCLSGGMFLIYFLLLCDFAATVKIVILLNFLIFPECPPELPILGHICVAPAGPQNCLYNQDTHCCCGQCGHIMSCVPDSITGAGTWQSTICPADGCGNEGC